MVDYCLRATKLANLLETLTPPQTGNIDDVAKMAAIAFKMQSPRNAEFNVEGPLHVTLKHIACHVIDFMTYVKEMTTHKMDLPPGVDAYMVQSYPMTLTLSLKVMVETPKVAVTEIYCKGKGVLATADISANTIVTFYPVDLIRIRCYESSSTVTGGMCSFVSAHKHLRELVGIEEMSARFDDYKYSISNVDIYGDPNTHPNGSYGHILNDGDGPVKGVNNSVLVPLFGGALIVVVAVFDIKKGSEVLASYGTGYWDKRVACARTAGGKWGKWRGLEGGRLQSERYR